MLVWVLMLAACGTYTGKQSSNGIMPKPQTALEVPQPLPDALPLVGQVVTALYNNGSTLYAGTPDGVFRKKGDTWLYEEGSGEIGHISAFAEFGGTLYAAAQQVDSYRTGGVLREEDGIWYIHTHTEHSVNTLGFRYAGLDRPALVAGTESGLYELQEDQNWRRIYPGGAQYHSARVSAYYELTTGTPDQDWTYDCIGLADDGVVCVQQDNPTSRIRFTAKIRGAHGLPGDQVSELLRVGGHGGNTGLVATADGGLAQIRIAKEDQSPQSTVSTSTIEITPVTSIRDIKMDSKGRVWITGAEGTAFREWGKWVLVDPTPGLALEFKDARVFIGTDEGLVSHELN